MPTHLMSFIFSWYVIAVVVVNSVCVVMTTTAKHEVGETHDRDTGVCCGDTPLDNITVARDAMFSSVFTG